MSSLLPNEDSLTAAKIAALIASDGEPDEPAPKSGYQASVHLVSLDGAQLVIKSLADEERLLWLRRRMLENERLAYARLEGITGIPRCYGLVDRKYLVLEHVEGFPFRDLDFSRDDPVHERLLSLIKQIHGRGVAHGDLKRRENMILGTSGQPYVIDFGTAVIRKEGFRPLNHYLFRLARQLDFHGWHKNKYRDRLAPADPDDARYYRPMRLERAARWVRRNCRGVLDAVRRRIR